MSDDFESKDYRDAFVEENIKTRVAFQIRALREKEGWTQQQLGEKAGKAQNVISRLEDPDYGKFTIRTLLDLASALDVGLEVTFVPFTHLVANSENFSPQRLAAEEAQLVRTTSALAVWWPFAFPVQLETQK